MARVGQVLVFWEAWGIHVMVMLSFAVQVILLLVADFRRSRDSAALKVIIWSAYMLADTTAVYALGHMAVVCRSPEHHLMALWAPLLLVHLGGQDNITAYAIEDNRLWLRHLQTFGVQALAVAFVLYQSSILGSRSLVLPATILMVVVGILKYGERVLALLRASDCASSSLSARNFKDFPKKADMLPVPSNSATRSMHEMSVPTLLDEGTIEEENGRSVKKEERRDTGSLLLIAYKLLDVPKQMFEGPTRYVELDTTHRLEGEEMFKVVEIQLMMMYDLLYTKAAVVHTWYGWCIRVFTLPATVVALVLFHASGDKDGYNRVDVVATYVLLGGAIVLEMISVARAMCSSWTSAFLVERKWVCLARMVTCLGELFNSAMQLPKEKELQYDADLFWHDKSYMRRYMGQHNLFVLCAGSRKNWTSKIARSMGREDRWGSAYYSWSTTVSQYTIDKVVKLLSESEGNQELDITKSRGRNALGRVMSENRVWELESYGSTQQLKWSVELELDESILVWHIATHLWLIQIRVENDELKLIKAGVAVVEALSNYMFFLLAARPYMLPYPVSRQKYVKLCYDVITSRKDLLGSMEEDVTGSRSQYELNIGYLAGSLRNETLDRGCQLAEQLIIKSANHSFGSVSTAEMVLNVWVEILCFTAYWCNENSHAKHLSDGGEIMTTVALLMLYRSSGLINKKDKTHQDDDASRSQDPGFDSRPAGSASADDIP